jgi:hypothetical protein
VEPAPDPGLWGRLERLLADASPAGIRTHKLGPLAARFARLRGDSAVRHGSGEEQGAQIAAVLVKPLLERIRSVCDGPLVLVKGPEVARLYPGSARAFGDVDLIVGRPEETQVALLAAGFEETGDSFPDAHHLRPLKWPGLGLKVEIHRHPSWPKRLEPPPFAEILEAARPATCGVDGVLAPDPAHHALILVAHGWKENPLGTLRDLVDVAAVAATTADDALEQAARRWRVERILDATRIVFDSVVSGEQLPWRLRLWAGHLQDVRARTPVESLLRDWLQSFWKLQLNEAVLELGTTVRRQARRKDDEPWRTKLKRASGRARRA